MDSVRTAHKSGKKGIISATIWRSSFGLARIARKRNGFRDILPLKRHHVCGLLSACSVHLDRVGKLLLNYPVQATGYRVGTLGIRAFVLCTGYKSEAHSLALK